MGIRFLDRMGIKGAQRQSNNADIPHTQAGVWCVCIRETCSEGAMKLERSCEDVLQTSLKHMKVETVIASDSIGTRHTLMSAGVLTTGLSSICNFSISSSLSSCTLSPSSDSLNSSSLGGLATRRSGAVKRVSLTSIDVRAQRHSRPLVRTAVNCQ